MLTAICKSCSAKMITHKFGLRHKPKLRNTLTSFAENGFVAFDYSAYPLQAYICYGIGIEEEKPTLFQNKLCKQGHIWKDTILSRRYQRKPNDCYICKSVNHTRDINSGKYAEQRRTLYQKNKDAHNKDCLTRYYKNKEEISKRTKLKARERREAILNGKLPRFYDGSQCKKCNSTLRYTSSNDCVFCTKQRSRQYAIDNSEKVYEQNKLYSVLNAEKVRQWRSKWVENNPDKARDVSRRRYDRLKTVLTIEYSKEEFLSHLELFCYQCAYCQTPLNMKSKNAWHLDHFLALSKNGDNHLGNYVPACKTCNLSKTDKQPYDWYKEQPFFDSKRWRDILAILWTYQERYGLYDQALLELIQMT